MTDRAAEQQLKKAYDCVVIGAGNGGLGAATQLAAKGAKVLVLEQHHSPGGFATSFVRGRFEFEGSLHTFADIGPAASSGTIRELLEKELGVHVDWVEIPEAFRLITFDQGETLDVTIPYGVQPFIDAIERAVPGSRPSVQKYMDLCQEVFEGISYIGRSRGNPDRKVLTKQYANFLKTCPYTMDQVADAIGVPQRARALLHAFWIYLGPPTSRLNFTVFAAMLHLLLTQGGWIPRLRSHEFVLALASRIKELGGDIEYNTRADQILVQDGRVAGVVTSRGDRIETRHVISNASPTLVYNQLVTPRSQVPEIAIRESNARVNGVSALVVYLGLDAPPDALGLHEYSYFVMGNLNSGQAYETFSALEGPQAQATACLNNAIPDCSPPGTSIVSITTLCRPEAWANVRPREYVKLKNRLANELISQFERATGAPLREHIEEIEVATPETFARYSGGDGGTIYGYEPEPWDSLMPRLMTFRDSVYIPGLDFCGGYAFRCHGFSSAFKSGQTIALLTLRDMIDKGEITP